MSFKVIVLPVTDSRLTVCDGWCKWVLGHSNIIMISISVSTSIIFTVTATATIPVIIINIGSIVVLGTCEQETKNKLGRIVIDDARVGMVGPCAYALAQAAVGEIFTPTSQNMVNIVSRTLGERC